MQANIDLDRDIIFIAARLDDVCEASIQQDANIEELQTRVNAIEERLHNICDALRELGQHYDRQLQILRSRILP